MRVLALLLCLSADLAAASAASAAESNWFVDGSGVVLNGYDVVAYFTEDRAVRGAAEHSLVHDGVKFFFASVANKDAFQKNPNAYAPEFGGFCAFGVAANKAKVPADPRTFKIYNGKLLLFFNDLYQGQPVNTKIMWNQNEQTLYGDASKTWPTLNRQ